MKEERKWRDEMDAAFGEMPETFHRRIEQTLRSLQAEQKEEPVVKRKVNGGIALLAALLMISAIGVAAKFTGILDDITRTAAKHWVLDDAGAMVRTNGESIRIGACQASVKEWVCDGQRLFLTLSVIDPALETEGYYVPKDEDEDYLAGLERYGLTHDPMEASSSAGTAQVKSSDFRWGNEANFEILYTYEIELENMPSAYTITLPVSCSEGVGELHIAIKDTDYGKQRKFEPSAVYSFDGYTAQVTMLQASSLKTYGELKLAFAAETDAIAREMTVTDYLEGLLAPEGMMTITAGEGEEIAYPTSATWSDDGLTATITLEGNPRESYPEKLAFYPRKGAGRFDGEGDWPSLSEEGAVEMELKLK